MNEMAIETKDGRVNYRPGDSIAGAAGWKLERAPESIELRLFWFTSGKGTSDLGLAATVTFEQPQAEEARPFVFTAPKFPVSFSGRIISLVWALELVVKPGTECARLHLVISPTGEELVPQTKITPTMRISFPGSS